MTTDSAPATSGAASPPGSRASRVILLLITGVTTILYSPVGGFLLGYLAFYYPFTSAGERDRDDALGEIPTGAVLGAVLVAVLALWLLVVLGRAMLGAEARAARHPRGRVAVAAVYTLVMAFAWVIDPFGGAPISLVVSAALVLTSIITVWRYLGHPRSVATR